MQIIAFLLLILAIMLLFSAKKESIEPRVKYAMAGAFFILTIGAIVYETWFSQKRHTNIELVNHFEQGGTLTCKDKMIDKIHYRYENGTQSFIAKKEFEKLSGVIVPLSVCEVANQ